MTSESAISAFTTTAGVTPDQISLLIRSILCALFLLWAAWNIYSQYQLVQTKVIDIHDMPICILRTLLLCSLMVILVFVA